MTTSAAMNLDLNFTIYYDAPSGLLQLTTARGTFTTHEDDVERWMRAGAAAIAHQIDAIFEHGGDIGLVESNGFQVPTVYSLPYFAQAIYVGSCDPGNEY